MNNLQILAAYSYLYDIRDAIIYKKKLKQTNFFLGGGRYGGKSLSAILLATELFLRDLPVVINFFRNLKNTVKNSVWSEIHTTLKNNADLSDFKVNYSDFTIANNNAEIKCYGLHKIKTDEINFKGWANIKQNYIINVFEEAWEIKDIDIDAVQASQRGMDLKQIFNFYIFNPDYINKSVVKTFTKMLPENDAILRDTGQQLAIVKNTLYHRTNRRINPFYNFKTNQLEEVLNRLYITNPELGKSWDLGKAGLGQMGVFTNSLKYIKYTNNATIISNTSEYFGGLDFGFKKDAFAFVLLGISKDKRDIVVIKEFYFENEKHNFNHKTIANLLLDWLNQQDITFNLRRGLFIVKCDYADYAFMEIMNDEARKRSMLWVVFEACKKLPIDIRIGHLLELIGRGSFYLNEFSTDKLYYELTVSQYKNPDETNDNLTLLDKNNHLLDALNYGIQPYLTYLQTHEDIKKRG